MTMMILYVTNVYRHLLRAWQSKVPNNELWTPFLFCCRHDRRIDPGNCCTRSSRYLATSRTHFTPLTFRCHLNTHVFTTR